MLECSRLTLKRELFNSFECQQASLSLTVLSTCSNILQSKLHLIQSNSWTAKEPRARFETMSGQNSIVNHNVNTIHWMVNYDPQFTIWEEIYSFTNPTNYDRLIIFEIIFKFQKLFCFIRTIWIRWFFGFKSVLFTSRLYKLCYNLASWTCRTTWKLLNVSTLFIEQFFNFEDLY